MTKISSSNNFDLLRVVLAIMVVFYHIGYLTNLEIFQVLKFHIDGAFAVEAFFVVSGFLVTMSYENAPGIKVYAQRRFRRIAPAYITSVLTGILLGAFLTTLTIRDYFSSAHVLKYLMFNLTLLNFKCPTLPGVFSHQYEPAINGALWTIKVEVAFYFLVPFLVKLIRRFGVGKVLLPIFILSVLYRAGFEILAQASGRPIFAILAKQIPAQLAFFVGGAYLYYRETSIKQIPWLLTLACGIIYLVSSGVIRAVVAPVAVCVLVAWMAVGLRCLGRFGKHGDFSYGIYLYHFPIIQTLIHLGWFDRGPWPTLVLACTLVGIAALLSWHLIEKPALSYRKGGGMPPSRTLEPASA